MTLELHKPPVEGLKIKEGYEDIARGCRYLEGQYNKPPHERDNALLTASELVVDVFYPSCSTQPGRESDQDILLDGSPILNLGGGGNVVESTRDYARKVDMVTRVGLLPPFADATLKMLNQLPNHVNVISVHDRSTPNSIKMRPQGADGQVITSLVFRTTPIDSTLVAEMLDRLEREVLPKMSGHESILISDYGRGMWDPELMRGFSEIFGSNGFEMLIDTRPTKDRNVDAKYNVKGILKPNRGELEALTGVKIPKAMEGDFHAGVLSAADILFHRYPNISGLLSTCDEDGAAYIPKDGSVTFVPPRIKPQAVVNPSGAGDIVLSTVGLLRGSGKFTMPDAIATATALSSLSVEEPGTSRLQPQLVNKLVAQISI